MGHSRPRPKRLAKKLLQIRLTLGVSQGEMVAFERIKLIQMRRLLESSLRCFEKRVPKLRAELRIILVGFEQGRG